MPIKDWVLGPSSAADVMSLEGGSHHFSPSNQTGPYLLAPAGRPGNPIESSPPYLIRPNNKGPAGGGVLPDHATGRRLSALRRRGGGIGRWEERDRRGDGPMGG